MLTKFYRATFPVEPGGMGQPSEFAEAGLNSCILTPVQRTSSPATGFASCSCPLSSPSSRRLQRTARRGPGSVRAGPCIRTAPEEVATTVAHPDPSAVIHDANSTLPVILSTVRFTFDDCPSPKCLRIWLFCRTGRVPRERDQCPSCSAPEPPLRRRLTTADGVGPPLR